MTMKHHTTVWRRLVAPAVSGLIAALGGGVLPGLVGTEAVAADFVPACARVALAAHESTGVDSYSRAQCALERRAYREAIALLEALIRKEDDPVYRADLGRAYIGAQEFERAREQFLQALASNPPEEARQLLRVFLQMAEQQQTQAREWFANVALGWLYDSNVNNGPSSRDILLFGLPFTLAEDGLPKSDRAWHLAANAVHAKPLARWESAALIWQTNLGLDALQYQTWHQYDAQQMLFDTGPHLRLLQDRLDLYLPLGGNRTYMNSQPYTLSRSFTPQVTYAVGQQDLALLALPLSRKSYDQASALDISSYGLALGWRHLWSSGWTLEPMLRFARDNARDDAYGNRAWTAQISLRGSLPAGLRLRAESSYGRARYLAAEFWADVPRDDSKISHLLSVSRDLPGGYYLSLTWQRSRTLSNLALYTSERDQIQVQLNKAF